MKKRKTKNILRGYAPGLDLWGLLLFCVIMLPNIVGWCVPALRKGFAENSALDIAALVFQIIAAAALIFIVQSERRELNFKSSLVGLTGVALLCYYLAWIFFYCGYWNAAVYLFLAVFPCVALVLFEVERRNWFALVPTAVFAVLHIVSACIHYL